MTCSETIKKEKDALVYRYGNRDNFSAAFQLLNTLIPYFALFYLAMASVTVSYWLTAGCIILLFLFTLRLFVLMHDCGHNSLFKTAVLNKIFGISLGVLCGMPQYVWSKHHSYHHATNGNWFRFRGALGILSTEEFSRLSARNQKTYQYKLSIWNGPLAGFIYFIFNPRYTWIMGSLQFVAYLLRSKISDPGRPLKLSASEFETKYWKTSKEYWHMFWNNFVLLSLWGIMAVYFGAATFFTVYILSLSLAGAAGLILFTVQHNFKASYASDDERWDYYKAVLEGTSYLVLPKILNWFTADIAYHHVHHLAAQIPNYHLARCHRENAHFFERVYRLRLKDISAAMHYVLWDIPSQKIVSIKQYREQLLAANQAKLFAQAHGKTRCQSRFQN